MTTYTAWDGNEYPLPTPDGWYLGTDERWWPEGHGPGPAPATPPTIPPTMSGMPSAAPPDTTIYSAPPAGHYDPGSFVSSTPPNDGEGSGKKIALAGVVLVGLVAAGAGAFFALSSSEDDGGDETAATTVFQTQQPDAVVGSTTTAVGSGAAVETTVPAAGRGSAEDPYQVGEPIVIEYTDGASGQVRTWNIEVLAPASDITQAVMDENQFNDPPVGDQQFVGAPIRVTYVSGPAPASLFELTFKAVGPSGVVLTTFDPSCGVIPEALDTFAELFEGGAVEGNVCWPASPADAEDLTMLVEVFLDDTEIYADLSG